MGRHMTAKQLLDAKLGVLFHPFVQPVPGPACCCGCCGVDAAATDASGAPY